MWDDGNERKCFIKYIAVAFGGGSPYLGRSCDRASEMCTIIFIDRLGVLGFLLSH